MMGPRQAEQPTLFYEFCLEERVPAVHLLRRVDTILDLEFVRPHMAQHYSRIGRPSIDPELMVRMLLVRYLYGIRSERRICEEVSLNLAFRWFCRLGLEGRVPDHSSFTKNRHGRFLDSALMRTVFERIVERCLAAGLASAEHVAVDGSFTRADASRERSVDSIEALPHETAPRAVRTFLDDLDHAAPDLDGVKRSPPKAVSLTDPAAALSRKHGPAAFAYGLNAMVDTASGIVLEVGAAPERFADEPGAACRMLERLERRHGASPCVLTADKAYGSGPFLAWLEARGVDTHVPLIDRREQTDAMSSATFGYDEASDSDTCPQGTVLKRVRSKELDIQRYRATQKACGACPIKASCTSAPARTICRSSHEAVRDCVRAREGAEPFRRSMALRRRVEFLFGAIKHNDGFRRLRLRGSRGAEEQFLLATTAQNLKRMSCAAALPSHLNAPAPG
jgi:transposase